MIIVSVLCRNSPSGRNVFKIVQNPRQFKIRAPLCEMALRFPPRSIRRLFDVSYKAQCNYLDEEMDPISSMFTLYSLRRSMSLCSESMKKVRRKLFAILNNSIGRRISSEDFSYFFLGIHTLFAFDIEEFKITLNNMSEEEKRTVRTHFDSPPYTCKFNSNHRFIPVVAKNLYPAIVQYRVLVAPEFQRCLEEAGIQGRNVCFEALNLDWHFISQYVKLEDLEESDREFFEVNLEKINDIIFMLEYNLMD